MIGAGVIAVLGAVVTGNGSFQIPAMGDAALKGTGVFTTGTAFPALFVTIACGAISGFHSLVSSGTTAKQLDNEKDAKPVAYGSMLIECVVAVISLLAVGFVWAAASDGTYASPTQVFAGGLSAMIGSFAPGAKDIMYQMLILAVSVFCLTSLDTATRLARYMFQEFFLEQGQTAKDATGYKKVLANPYVATAITVVLGVALGMTGYTKIWPLFGAANVIHKRIKLTILYLIYLICGIGNYIVLPLLTAACINKEIYLFTKVCFEHLLNVLCSHCTSGLKISSAHVDHNGDIIFSVTLYYSPFFT